MNKMNWKWTLVFSAAVIGTTVLLDAQAWAGKPTPPPPTPPPIHYQIKYFTAPDGDGHLGVTAMNNSGMMVGSYHPATHTGYSYGYLYNPRIDADQAIDLNDLVQIPEVDPESPEWYIDGACSINNCETTDDCGVILVTVKKILYPASWERRGLLIDTRGKFFPSTSTPRWTATWIPVVQNPWNPAVTLKTCYGRSINNSGDLLGLFYDGTQWGAFVYSTGLYNMPRTLPTNPIVLPFTLYNIGVSLNDPILDMPLRVTGSANIEGTNAIPFRYSPGASVPLETFPELCSPPGAQPPAVEAINGYGEFCGRIYVPTQKNVSKYIGRPFRFDPDLQESPTLLGNESEHAGLIGMDINNTSDVAASVIGKMYLFHSTEGAFNSDNLVIGTTDEVNTWVNSMQGYNTHLTERDSTGFPWIGSSVSETLGCLLIPVK